MSNWSPPSVPRSWLVTGLGLWIIWFAYSYVIVQQLALGLFPLFLFGGVYVVWRFLVAFEGIADGLQRIADQQERGGGYGEESADQ